MPEPDHRDTTRGRFPNRHSRTHRDAILAVLTEEQRSLSAREVYLALVEQRGTPIGLTTVYRVLHRVVDDHQATTVRAEDGTVRYLPIRPGSHHRYLLCRNCGRADPFSAPEVEQFCDQFASRHGFTDIDLHLQLHGICPHCREPEVNG